MEYHSSVQDTMKNYDTTQKYIKEFINERFKTSDKYLSELSYKSITDLILPTQQEAGERSKSLK
jgi:hypothetical protein